MKRKVLKRVHKGFLKASVMAASLTFIVSGMMLDNLSLTPFIVCAGCILYIAAFVYANRREFEKWT